MKDTKVSNKIKEVDYTKTSFSEIKNEIIEGKRCSCLENYLSGLSEKMYVCQGKSEVLHVRFRIGHIES